MKKNIVAMRVINLSACPILNIFQSIVFRKRYWVIFRIWLSGARINMAPEIFRMRWILVMGF